MTNIIIDTARIPCLLSDILENASNFDERNNSFSDNLKDNLQKIAEMSEDSKGVLAVIITSLVVKNIAPEQDIRAHQAQLPNGYSGRTIDTGFITPFLKRNNFPAMAESGWLTRSLEVSAPYNENYPGKMKNKELNEYFISAIGEINSNPTFTRPALLFLFKKLIQLRDSRSIQLSRPVEISIEQIIIYLEQHFNPARYSVSGASRLPTIALFSAYQCMLSEMKRFEGKTLLPLESHTSADSRSGRIGDVQVNDGVAPFEGVEVKHGIKITAQLVLDAYDKFKTHQTKRYYLLSTVESDSAEKALISEKIALIRNGHGCQVIVNGIIPTLKYYLRLLENPSSFIQNYVTNLEGDETIKFQHKEMWNRVTTP